MRKTLFIVLLSASVAGNLVLGIVLLTRSPQPAPPDSRTASLSSLLGKMAPEIYARPVGGNRVRLRLSARPTIVYVISPGCGWCARNTANITALWKQRSNDLDFVGLSLHDNGLEAYLSEHPLPFSVAVAEPDTVAAYAMGVTPSTLYISSEGILAKKWNGAWNKTLPVIERTFGVKLPGIEDGRSAGPGDSD